METVGIILLVIFLGKIVVKKLDGVILAVLETKSLEKLIDLLDDDKTTTKKKKH